MFPFERVIGDLQCSSTNYKLGEQCPLPTGHDPCQNNGQIEMTMFAVFCTKSTTHVVIKHLSDLDEWKDSIVVMEQSFNTEKRGRYIPKMCTSSKMKATQIVAQHTVQHTGDGDSPL